MHSPAPLKCLFLFCLQCFYLSHPLKIKLTQLFLQAPPSPGTPAYLPSP